MNDIRTLLQTAAKRIGLSLLIDQLHRLAVILAAGALLLMIADRVPASPFVPWLWVGIGAVVVLIGVGVPLWARRRPDEVGLALAVDTRLALKEKLSTALHCEGREDPFAQAAIEDAVDVARDQRVRERVRRTFAVSGPKRWWISPLLLLVAFGMWFLPQADLFAADEDVIDDAAYEVAKSDSEQAVEAAIKMVEQNPELAEQLGETINELRDESNAKERTAEDVKREAIKKLTSLNTRLDEITRGEQGKTEKAKRNKLSKLKQAENGAAKELSDALARGDFSEAKKALEKMASGGELSDEQKAQMAELADSLQDLANDQSQLKNALKQAGLDPDVANDPQKMKDAINDSKLSDQQKQQLQQMAQAQQNAGQMCQNLGQMCQNIAQSMDGEQSQAAAGQMGEQLSDLEMMQQMVNQARAAAGQCQDLAEGMGCKAGDGQGQSQLAQGKPGSGASTSGVPGQGQGGTGGQGQGNAAGMQANPNPTKHIAQRTNTSKSKQGDIIASHVIDGELAKGESNKKARQAIGEIADTTLEGLNDDPLPRKYHEVLKHYFRTLKKRATDETPLNEQK